MRTLHLLAILVLAPALASAQQPCSPDAGSAVDAAYRQVLERPARGEGNDLAEQLRSGQTTVRDIVRHIAKSPEHRMRFLSGRGPAGRTEAVTNLYRHLLGRAPDPAGLRGHVQALEDRDVASVIDTMIDSPEYEQKYGDNTVPGSSTPYCANGFDREERPIAQPRFDPESSAWTDDAFRQVDRNGDGRITSNEWYHGPEHFRRADRNRDGTLTLSEFTGAARVNERDERFDNLDRNRNGRIERSEWVGSVDAFEWLDRNGDNVLSREEVVGDSSNR